MSVQAVRRLCECVCRLCAPPPPFTPAIQLSALPSTRPPIVKYQSLRVRHLQQCSSLAWVWQTWCARCAACMGTVLARTSALCTSVPAPFRPADLEEAHHAPPPAQFRPDIYPCSRQRCCRCYPCPSSKFSHPANRSQPITNTSHDHIFSLAGRPAMLRPWSCS